MVGRLDSVVLTGRRQLEMQHAVLVWQGPVGDHTGFVLAPFQKPSSCGPSGRA
jgi:hypothetical protein